MKTLWIFISLLLFHFVSPAQNTNKVWAFGWGCGIDFNTSPPTPILTSANAYEGCASISDSHGQLLMYATGDTVYNRHNRSMPNGGNIGGTPFLGSCTQGSLIVPRPGSTTQYYVFTLQGITDGLPQGKLFYNLVDMTLDGGLGDVVPGQKLKQVDIGLSEKLTAVAGDCNNIWVIVCPQSGDAFRAYEVTAAGVNLTPVISPFAIISPGMYDIGVLKAAHNGKKLIAANYNGAGFQLFDFDNAKGIASNPINFTDAPSVTPYAACFSPDDSRLYLLFDSICQYDLSLSTTAAILASKVNIASILVGIQVCGDMQTAPDGKLYISKLNTSFSIVPTVASINSPNTRGTACGFNPYAITLPASAKVGIGLPNAVVNPVAWTGPDIHVHDTTMCGTLTASSSASNGSYIWSTGDTSSSIQISNGGVYWVVSSAACGVIDTFHVIREDIKLDLEDATVCTGDSVVIPVSLNVSSTSTILWSTGATQSTIVFQDTGVYWVQVTEGSCLERDTIEIRYTPCGCEFFLPNVFSPNGDGLNDYFKPKFLTTNYTCTEHFVLKVFNRWGEEVYSGTQSSDGWNGYYRNQPVDVGVYMFYVIYEDVNGNQHSQKGDVTLLR